MDGIFGRLYTVHRITSHKSSSLLPQQYPARLTRFSWMVYIMRSKWSYNCCFVGCYFQVLQLCDVVYNQDTIEKESKNCIRSFSKKKVIKESLRAKAIQLLLLYPRRFRMFCFSNVSDAKFGKLLGKIRTIFGKNRYSEKSIYNFSNSGYSSVHPKE